ncbi:NAD(P)-dependent alcohol dehydrogenase [Microbacterium sp. Gd 4-13]|uniref:NAD(P)-dependent alcohol dehydrogenase n=1 Tax=Microbacterium sp. Gd 4-13 TaxID=2173179 RepID=UPI000D587380|nr:NAD(P)-dependent alcohol dehydrogenase [Microbacterium sp. Gd 4-13]PVW03298.1 NAD(P)-dependent alcohol dehydrogenase [Microbacterium sp. Gd 4-13]
MTPATRVAIMTGVETTSIEDRMLRPLDRGEVLVRVASVGVCGSDVHWYRDGRIGDTVVTDPLVLGHEASGTITEVGAGVDPSRVGTRVAIEPGIPCRECDQCSAGRYNLCPFVRFFATPPVDGAFATHVITQDAFAHAVPDSLTDDEAALIEPLSVAVWANRAGRVSLGDRVLVTGAGPIGLLVLQVARSSGAVVTVTDISDDRLALASELGADRTVNASTPSDADRYDVLIECSGAASAIDSGIRALAPAGRAVLVGMAASASVAVPLDVIQSRELQITGTFRYANVYPAAIHLAASGRVQLTRLVTSVHDLDHVDDALMASSRDPLALKSIVRPQAQESPSA